MSEEGRKGGGEEGRERGRERQREGGTHMVHVYECAILYIVYFDRHNSLSMLCTSCVYT